MHRFWHHVIRPILEAADPATIVEVGAYRGENTRNLVDYAREHGAALHVVDPAPLFDPAELLGPAGDRAVFHRTLSLNVLGSIEAPDAVLIDGDHNWFTVINELRLLARSSGRAGRAFPLVLLHDVGWPYGRRDLYYEPDRIPDAFRQPVRRGGLRPETPELAKTGGLNPHLDHSIYENDLRNGVLTAVEDFVAESAEELRVVTLPGLHGLGLVVAARRLEERPALAAAVARLGSAEFLEEHARWVERARIDVLIESVEQRARRQAAEQQLAEVTAALEHLHAEVDAARSRAAERAADAERHERRVAELEREVEAARRAERALEATLSRREAELAEAAQDRDRLETEEAGRRVALEEALERATAAEQEAARRHEAEVSALRTAQAALEASVEELRETLATRERMLAQADEQHATLTAEVEELRRRLAALAAERDAELQQREAQLQQRNAELRLRDQALADQERRLAEAERARQALLARVDDARRQAADAVADARRELQAVDADIKRVEASKAWRLGHGLARLARTLTFRRDHGTHGLRRASARIALALPPPAEPEAAQPAPQPEPGPAPAPPPQQQQPTHAPTPEPAAGPAERTRAIIDTFIRDVAPLWVERSQERNEAFLERLREAQAAPPPRVLVGTLHSGENEFDRCKAAIAAQDYPAFEHVVVSGLPKKQSVATLMERFLGSDFDVLVKIDADTVLLDQDFLSRVVEIFQSEPDRDLVQIAMLDFFSGRAMQGINAYRRTIDWRPERQDALFTDKTFIHKSRRLVVWGPFVRSAIHSPDPAPFQAFHFGVHRGLKARQPLAAAFNEEQAVEQTVYLEKTWEHFLLRRDRRLGLACLGFELALGGRYELAHLDYTNPALESAFSEFSGLSVQELEELVREHRDRRGSRGRVDRVRERRREELQRHTAPISSIVVPLPHFGIYGGVNRFFALSERFAAHGVECVLAKPDAAWGFYGNKGLPEERPDFPDVPTIELGEALDRTWDVVLCGDCTSGVMLTLPYFRSRLNAVYLLNGWRHREANVRQVRLTDPDLVIANSSWAARFYRDLAPVVVPGGIDASLFAADAARTLDDMPREEAAWPGERLRVVAYGGRQKTLKRFEDVVDGCRLAYDTGVPLELHVFDERPLVLDPGFPVVFHGKLERQEVAELMRGMDVMVSAEQDAGWSNPTAEAMASGASVICTPAGTCDFAIDGETALVVPIGDPAAIAAALVRLWREPALALDLRRNGVRRVREFEWEVVARSLLDVFGDVRRDDSRRRQLNARAREQVERQLGAVGVPA